MRSLFSLSLIACMACGSDAATKEATARKDAGSSQDESPDADISEVIKCPASSLSKGDYTLKMMHDGKERTYALHVPAGLAKTSALIVNFHGYNSNALEEQVLSQMNDFADREKVVVAYPEGIKGTFDAGSRSGQAWNAGTCCTDDDPTRDDLGFARALVDDIESKVCIDPRRVYATGMSNGGFMTHKLACSASDVFAAFAPVSARLVVPHSECKPGRPIPIVMFNGTADSSVPYDGSDEFETASESLNFWKTHNECKGEAKETFSQGAVRCATYNQCAAGAEVTLCSIEGMEHCWPGQPLCPSGASTTEIDANEVMWVFFQRFPLP